MLAHLMANAARGDEVARTALECLEEELGAVLISTGQWVPRRWHWEVRGADLVASD